jgi:hypothetical protein
MTVYRDSIRYKIAGKSAKCDPTVARQLLNFDSQCEYWDNLSLKEQAEELLKSYSYRIKRELKSAKMHINYLKESAKEKKQRVDSICLLWDGKYSILKREDYFFEMKLRPVLENIIEKELILNFPRDTTNPEEPPKDTGTDYA